ncbi:diol dehydratase small subunit [Vallitalea okinawensis]|uniref:diol dehydratase small subunit n=1 Tax=Vallitalea okinawensis TaxID=2078660 RepID=UPI0014784432|nr:diol dehydratase small subunit [Vallitalea okinawensis]
MIKYPLSENHTDTLTSRTGKRLSEVYIEDVLAGTVTAEDIKISKDTLKMQGEVAKDHGKKQMARNFTRAGELVEVNDQLILEIYNKLRPNRSTKKELMDYAVHLETKYMAFETAMLVREAAEVYERRGILMA